MTPFAEPSRVNVLPVRVTPFALVSTVIVLLSWAVVPPQDCLLPEPLRVTPFVSCMMTVSSQVGGPYVLLTDAYVRRYLP